MEQTIENETMILKKESSGNFSTKKYGAEIEDEIPLYIFDILLTERKSRLVVKFSTRDGGIFAQSFLPNTDFEYIKCIAAAIIQVKPRRMKPNVIKLKLTKHEQINEFKNDPHEALPCMISSKKFMEKLIRLCDYEELVIPDYMCVTITDSVTDTTKCVPVEVYNRAIDKPWDGGYRNMRTGIEFHNAFSQTGPRPPVRGPDLMSTRDTQTSWCRNRKLDMPYSQATQMYKNDLFVSCITDRILTPRPYECSEDRQRRLNTEAKIRTIQRYFRAWKMRRSLKRLHAEYQDRKMKEFARREAELEDDRRRRRKDLICQVFPKSRIDFAMLYAIADKWKRGEISKISSMYCGPAKVAELALLSDKEVEVFKAIEKLQQVVKRDAVKQKELSYLKKLDWNEFERNN
ncbi:IQ and ubiquitin-like domain-containing protein isoform X4 [Coccinella septempunctata]|uniref:IQ and ubiquitin-like domain-containing protein isoform X4 n=1 Tax=Coccinella septempunctata TaxID=41139 RepID=UPI001D09090A|nr:IQ and ubiquitin-like domain-containing protein isoform X4 [Coccinella septempunctata]